MSLGRGGANRGRTLVQPRLGNLRYFSRTPTARRAINAIKNPIKDLPWEVRVKKNVTTNPLLDRQIRVVTNCLEVPNNDDSFSSFIEQILEDYLAVSAGCWEQQYGDSSDHPVYLFPVDATTIQQDASWSGDRSAPRYAQTFGGQIGDIPDLLDDEIVYIKPNPSTENPWGYGPLEIAAASISRQLGAAEYAGNVASNAAPVNLIHLGNIGANELNSFRTFWRNEVEGQGNTPLIGGDGEPKVMRLGGENDDGLYLKWQEFLVLEVARAFDLSPQTFGLMREQTRVANGQQSSTNDSRDFQQAVKPTALKIKDFINRKLIVGKLGFTQIEFFWPTLDSEDQKKQAEIDELLYQNNALLPSEMRASRGWPALSNEYMDMTYAEVQVKIGEARRGNAAQEGQPGTLQNTPTRVRNQNRNQ